MNYLQRLTVFFALLFLLFYVSGDAKVLTADDLIHVVGKGETIYSISRFYRVTADDLMKANKITDPSKLQTGKKLIIPSSAFSEIPDTTGTSVPLPNTNSAQKVSSATNITDYRVVKGDTLYSIARTNGITLQTLLDLNKFSSGHVIKAGDVIKVPERNTVNTAQTASSGNNSNGNNSKTTDAGSKIYSLQWPVSPKDIAYMTGQTGVVVGGEYNESVKSLTQGKVISAGPWRKFGRVAIVETSGGYFYMYGGCESLSVKVGDKVSPGTEVGKLGINAVSEKAQLFFMVFRSDNPIDPALAPRAAGNLKT
ncbi:MAG: LysM peptidoglycan-binding domain-containing protein [Spirochaetes bacterium]|nr:LysM peptidoglycan-binding domain-containing protein [Brevinematales bacterium]MCL1958656.1 LysM peptidoglycan-binding domain-containing protein [Spirochaetota bacterium]